MRAVLRRLTSAGLLATGLIATTTPAMAGTISAGTPAPRPSGSQGSAYGLTASGLIPVAPVPAVASTSGEVSKSLLREDHTKLVKASALAVRAKAGHARSSVARLSVPAAQLLASAVTATCDGGRGRAHLANATIAGRRLSVAPPPNTTVPVDLDGVGRASLVLNKQQRLQDGRLAVTAMELSLPLKGATTIRIASATCGQVHTPIPAAEAPAPTPVKRDFPVAG
ncbi:choice-of-anchor P family protein [Actinomadura macra]|uniref:choice-of-anchor P family protein n=1 Tax=Actinomadura macra TaxID=46164 RepID=UPI00083677FB|nr:choice-of-anchor P family protein [Actinomadura macra]